MNKFEKPPSLSTNFSESGKQAKKRFDNILNTKAKKTGALAFAAVLILICVAGTLLACKSNDTAIIGGADGPTAIHTTKNKEKTIKELYNAKLKYVGNASGVAKILGILGGVDGGVATGMELETKKEPYGIIRNFKGTSKDIKEMERQAAIILCLVENADFVNYVFDDNIYNFNREKLNETYGKPLADYSQSLNSFTEFYILVYTPTVSIEEVVTKAIFDQNKGGYLGGECVAEGHIILGSEGMVLANGDAKYPDKTFVYTFVTYGEYGFENGNFTKISGSGVIPVRITLDKNNNVIEYLEARDGSEYEPSIKEMFPEGLWNRALSGNEADNTECKKQERVYAQNYLNSIGRAAPIGDYADFEHKLPDMNVGVSNNLLSMFDEYPMWIGTEEKIENGIRYVYERQWKDNGNGDGMVTFKKYEYDTKKVIEETVIDTKNGEMKYLKGAPREEKHS